MAWLVGLPLLAGAAEPPAGAVEKSMARLMAGEVVELIVEFDADTVDFPIAAARRRHPRRIDDDGQLAHKAAGYRALKAEINAAIDNREQETLRDYSHLPMSFMRFRTAAALTAMLARPEVRAVHENVRLFAITAESLPLIGQPAVAVSGAGGSGTTVAMLDTGINLGHAAFGGCTAPGVPASCRVAASLDMGGGGSDPAHGTNVAAIVAGVAPSAKIVALNVFTGSGAAYADVVEGINWTIANRSAYNIVALNLSLGDGINHSTPCGFGYAFYSPVTAAINAGISVVAAAGNEARVNGMSSPACTPGAVSVGAVYDGNIGGVSWGSGLCSDTSTSADNIACFSNSASFLTLLAPGALINAGGFNMGGTSQAAPHAAGALAVLRSAYPAETRIAIETRLSGRGKPVTDPRNGILKPRLDLLAAARPINDAFASRVSLSGTAGSTGGNTALASRESAEPQHAGNAGGHSLWWTLTPASSGQLSLDTLGSDFDTLLAVYSGTSLAALTPLAADDGAKGGNSVGASATLLQVSAGVPLSIVIDGAGGAAGAATLNWNLNANARADLSVSVSGPVLVEPGSPGNYLLRVANTGPQAATQVTVTLALPASALILTLPTGCGLAGDQVLCAVGTLSSGSSAEFSLELQWSTDEAVAPLIAAASSAVPDLLVTDNTTTIAVTVAAAGSSGDVPTMPEWAALLLGGLMFARSRRLMGG